MYIYFSFSLVHPSIRHVFFLSHGMNLHEPHILRSIIISGWNRDVRSDEVDKDSNPGGEECMHATVGSCLCLQFPSSRI